MISIKFLVSFVLSWLCQLIKIWELFKQNGIKTQQVLTNTALMNFLNDIHWILIGVCN